jgi:hypothetical protein
MILLTKYYLRDQMENNVSRACSKFWEERRVFLGGYLRERDCLGDPGVNGRIMLTHWGRGI